MQRIVRDSPCDRPAKLPEHVLRVGHRTVGDGDRSLGVAGFVEEVALRAELVTAACKSAEDEATFRVGLGPGFTEVLLERCCSRRDKLFATGANSPSSIARR